LVKPLSIDEAYQWAQRFVAREWRLLLPVVFAFMALPGLVFALPPFQEAGARFATAIQAHDLVGAAAILRWMVPIALVVFLIGAFGGLAVTALGLLPAISVGEALGLAARRFPVLIASLVLVLFGEVALTIVLTILLGVARVTAVGVQSAIWLVLVGLGIFLGVRLLLLGETWLMTQGLFWRIFAAAAVYLVGAMVVMLALSTVVGSLLVMLGNAAGAPELGQVINVIFQQAIQAMLALGFHLLAVAIFRQLDGSTRGI
jgi:hypothetical protein